MKNLLIIFIFISSHVIAQEPMQQYFLGIAEGNYNELKSVSDSTIKILTKRLHESGYENSIVKYNSEKKQFVITGNDVLNDTFINKLLIKPRRVTFYECYTLVELATKLFAQNKPAKFIQQRIEFLKLLHANNDNLNNKQIGFLGVVNQKDTATFNKVKTALKSYLPPDAVFIYRHKLLENTDTSIEIYGLRNNTAKLPVNSLLDSAKMKINNNGTANILLYFNKIGKMALAKITKNNVDKILALVIDDEVFSAPFVNGEVESGEAEISGDFTIKEGNQLVDMFTGEELPIKLCLIK